MKGCVSQKNSYIFTDELYADLDNIQKGCRGRWGEGGGGKKNPKGKNMESYAARACLPAGGCHFLRILNLYCLVLAPLPPAASLSALVTRVPAGGCWAGGFPPCVIQSPWGMCCIVRGDSSQRYSAHYSPSRAITHLQYPPGSEENIDQRSLFPHPGYRLGNK